MKVLGFGDNVVDQYEHIKIAYPGGNCVNFCVYAKMMGVERSAYMGYFGSDYNADIVMDALSAFGVETVKCAQLSGENGWSKVTLVDGDRTFVASNNGGIRGKTPFVLNRFDLEYISGFDLVHTGNYSFTEGELYKIREAGIPVSFDFSDDSTTEYYKDVLKFVDYAFCSHSGSVQEVEEHLRMMVSGGAKLALATRGAEGCILFDGVHFYEQKAKLADELVDTMGAGDSLIASFVISYLDRMKSGAEHECAIRESLEFASAFASRICGMNGAFGCGRHYENED